MKIISATALTAALDYAALIDRIEETFREGCTVPVRHHHTIPVSGEPDATLLLMPAWRDGHFVGVKVVTVFPGNAARALPAIAASYLLFDGVTGVLQALLDGGELTARRTAAASALASRYLSRADSTRLLMVGTGTMAPHLIRAHACARPIREVAIWGRRPEKAKSLADALDGPDLKAAPVADLEAAVGAADIITCATLATDPLIRGGWLRAGQHLDLVGAFTPQMAEADDAALARARVYVDTRDGALAESGELVGAIERGVIGQDDIQGDLFDLARGAAQGRAGAGEITLFKSVGTALEDFAAATLAIERT
ncbi:MAG: ornithine cyclodeaminase family protein [Rhodospirillales bacterium]|nr:ornithine cyclodeaminase family protein [Rhodospirillales bacterium]